MAWQQVLLPHTEREDVWKKDYYSSKLCVKKGSFGQMRFSNLNLTYVIHKKQIKLSTLAEMELAKLPFHKNILLGSNYTLDGIDILTCYLYNDVSIPFDLLTKHKNLQLEQIAYVMMQVLSGLEYLQEKSVIHCNLNQKCLFVKENNIKIADFSFACLLAFGERAAKANLNFPYNGPDQLDPPKLSLQTDVWAFGIIAAELLSNKSGFPYTLCPPEQNNPNWQFAQFKNCDILENLCNLDVSAKTLITQCLKFKASKRPTLSQIKNFEFVNTTQLLFRQ